MSIAHRLGSGSPRASVRLSPRRLSALLFLPLLAGLLPDKPVNAETFAKAVIAFRKGDYESAARRLRKTPAVLPKNNDYYLYFLGESQFYAGRYERAHAAFTKLSKLRSSRFADIAQWRAADCLWMKNKRREAAAAYRKLLAHPGAADPAVARFRVAEVEAEAAHRKGTDARTAAARSFMQIHVDFPAHPLGIRAGQRASELTPPSSAEQRQRGPTPLERLQRASTLSRGRHWRQAVDELARLPASLPPELADQRDLAMGTAMLQGRIDYAEAARLLLSVASRLDGDKAAFATFYGARALSRAHRDDEAIAHYRALASKYPAARWAGEAQFRAGWLEVNRGNFRAALPDLRRTMSQSPGSALAEHAAWYVTLCHHLLGQTASALSAITVYEQKASRSNESAALRALYWRARMLLLAGQPDEAKTLFRECAARAPFSYYALLSQARLRELGEAPAQPSPSLRSSKPVLPRDPELARILELEEVGLDVEAGIELARREDRIIKRYGPAGALSFLLPTFHRLKAFHHARKLADSEAPSVLRDTQLYWQAAYPRAFPELVHTYTRDTNTPELFVYAIMRKESDYHPFALSRSDARGLLQLIPSTSARVAKKLGEESFRDELFDPETNIRRGVTYLGELLHRFRGQEALAAGAYNAGEHAMMRWCDRWAGHQLDEFVELISYSQSREYVKRVLGIYARYRHLYGRPFALTMTVNTDYLRDI